MISDTDWNILMKKLEAIDERLEKLELFVGITKRPGYALPGIIPQIPCVFDSLPPEDRMKPMGITCSCPKCSPYCLSSGSLSDSGIKQEWRNIPTTLDAIGGTDSKVSFETIQTWRIATDKEDYEE